MSSDPDRPNATIAAPPQRPRIRFAIRLRTMLLIVLGVAAALGYWDYRRRRAPVDYLLSRVPVSVFIHSRPTHSGHDSTYDPGGTFAVAIRRVRELHQEEAAATELTEALRAARASGDDKSIRGALAALQGLGPANRAAAGEIARVVRAEGLPRDRLGDFSMSRALAVHVLAMIAEKDEAWLPTVVAAVSLPDPSPDRVLTASACSELSAFGPKAKGAVPALVALLEVVAHESALPGLPATPAGSSTLLNLGCVPSALGAIGPDANPALPRLMAMARDPAAADFARSTAASAVIGISWPRDAERAPPEELITFLHDLAADDAPLVRSTAEAHLRQVDSLAQIRRRREELKRLIASDRARGGRPRPKADAKP